MVIIKIPGESIPHCQNHPRLKLLLVEDSYMNRDMMSRRLTKCGFAVVLAGDGYEGLAMAESVCPDVIVLDLTLPGLNGWEVARRLKASAKTRSIPIIALTANAMSGASLEPDRVRQLLLEQCASNRDSSSGSN